MLNSNFRSSNIRKIVNVQNLQRLYALSKRNVILRYKNSIIGFFWGFFKPLLYLLIFVVIFSKGFPNTNNYVLYATSGLILWFFFSNITNQSVSSIIGSAGILKSLNIPPILFPISEIVSEVFNLLLSLAVFFVLMHWFGIVYSPKLLLIFGCIALFSVFTMGLNLMLSAMNVFFRDVGIIWSTVQPAVFYLTPIPYPESMIPAQYKFIINCNPIYYFIKLGRYILYYPEYPSAMLWLQCTLIACVTLGLGYFVFNKLKNQFISAI
ncbi:MAG: ABC transporter permease [Chitinophagia bacterium]|nr:ABC transporter permease [Chitinophagia bacterium]